MESRCLSKHKSSFLIFMMLLFSLVGWIHGIYIEDEGRALLEIKASLHEVSNFFNVDNLLPTWVDHGSNYCNWERVKCNTTSGYVTDLSLSSMFCEDECDLNYWSRRGMIWPLNVSLFLQFKELRRLDLSWNYIGNTFLSTGLKRFSGLKKLESLNLSTNYIQTNIFPLLNELRSLKILDLSGFNQRGDDYPDYHYDISEFQILENLEVLNLNGCGCSGAIQMQGSVATLKKLEFLNLGDNLFNESLVTSLHALTSLKVLDLQSNLLYRSFPSEELSHLTNLEKLDLSGNSFETPSIQGCKSLMRLKNLEGISLSNNNFNKSIISCLSFIPSLKILDLSSNDLGSSFPMQELSSLKELTTLDVSGCGLETVPSNGTILSNLQHLNLDHNHFFLVEDIMRSMAAFPSLKFLSLQDSFFKGGRINKVPKLPYLEVLMLNQNDLNGTLPIEALASFHHLKVLDLSGNSYVGSIPSTIKSLPYLEAVSFANNNLNGSLPHELCELEHLNELDLRANMFDGNLPECLNKLTSLKLLDISSNKFMGVIPPSVTANLKSLEYVDFSHNKFEGVFSFSSFSNHTKLEFVSFQSDDDKFRVEIEEPIGWTPMFQLKVLVLSNCNIHGRKGSIVARFLLGQHRLMELDMSHNSLDGQFPSLLIKNNPMLEVVNLRNNSFDNISSVLSYGNPSTTWVDISGNHMIGAIPRDIQKLLPKINYLNLSRNNLDGSIPSSIGDLAELRILDLSHNDLSGDVPTVLFTNLSQMTTLKLSNNSLYGDILSGELSIGGMVTLHLDSNSFTGKIGNRSTYSELTRLDISNNFFTGAIPDWITDMRTMSELVVRNNSLGGPFPCGIASFSFLDMSQNYFSGLIPSCSNFQSLEHLHLGSNKFTGSIPNSFRNLTNMLTLDIGNNYLSGRIPKFLGELSNLKILLLRKNNFRGSIPKELCQLTNASLIDLSSNSISGSIPSCLQNIADLSYQAFLQTRSTYSTGFTYHYPSILNRLLTYTGEYDVINEQDEVLFTTKTLSLSYKGGALNIMSGLDLSCNKLTGDIPEELGLLTQIHALNLSHNRLTGAIPAKFSNLANIESLDLSFNRLTGEVPSQLAKLSSLAVFNVSFNNLSGRLPEMKAQFGTFSKESYEGNPLLCGLPLDNKCATESHVTHPLNVEESNEKWYDIDTTSFYGSCGSTWFVLMLGFATLLCINPYWRRMWLNLVEECMYQCYYFLYDLVRKLCMIFNKQD